MAKIAILALILFTSCISSQKKLQRRIEKNGIKESISFVVLKYPEYFKKKDTTILDTIIINDTITLAGDTLNVLLLDSNNTLSFNNDSVSITINKANQKAKIIWKEKKRPYEKIVYRDVNCPDVICPDCDDLKDCKREITPTTGGSCAGVTNKVGPYGFNNVTIENFGVFSTSPLNILLWIGILYLIGKVVLKK